jgi:hypothetical protein
MMWELEIRSHNLFSRCKMAWGWWVGRYQSGVSLFSQMFWYSRYRNRLSRDDVVVCVCMMTSYNDENKQTYRVLMKGAKRQEGYDDIYTKWPRDVKRENVGSGEKRHDDRQY